MNGPSSVEAPKVSVVIASIAGPESLVGCVNSFLDQHGADALEVIVVTCAHSQTIGRLSQLCPRVQLIRVAERASIPDLRAVGFSHARGAILAMTQDTCVARADWTEHLLRAHASEHLAIGGAVENRATERTIDWAAYFCEYGRYMLPLRTGPTDDLPGPNVTYKRLALEHFRDLLSPASWESLWHWRLRERGVALIADAGLVVYQRKPFTFRGFAAERFHYSRSFAGRRVADASLVMRLLFALGALALPPLLMVRIVRRVWSKRRHRRELLRSLPYLAMFTVVWSVGELVGYLFGEGLSAMAIE